MKKKYTFVTVIIIISILITGIYGYFAFFGTSPYAPYFLSNLMAPSSQVRAFNKDDRILIVAPHPDDEMLSAGGINLEGQNNIKVSTVLSKDLDIGSLLRIYMFPYCGNNDFAQTTQIFNRD